MHSGTDEEDEDDEEAEAEAEADDDADAADEGTVGTGTVRGADEACELLSILCCNEWVKSYVCEK